MCNFLVGGSGLDELPRFTPAWKNDFNVYSQQMSEDMRPVAS
jgi:hypothetical protein